MTMESCKIGHHNIKILLFLENEPQPENLVFSVYQIFIVLLKPHFKKMLTFIKVILFYKENKR